MNFSHLKKNSDQQDYTDLVVSAKRLLHDCSCFILIAHVPRGRSVFTEQILKSGSLRIHADMLIALKKDFVNTSKTILGDGLI